MSQRLRTVLIFSFLLVALFVLAASLSGLELKPGVVFDIKTADRPAGFSSGPSISIFATLMRGFLALIIILLPFYVIYMLMDKERRKRLLADIVAIALVIFALTQFSQLAEKQQQVDEPLGVPSGPLATPVLGPQGTPVEAPGAPSETAVTASALIFAGIAVAVIAGGLFWLASRRKGPAPEIAQLAEQAEETIEALLAGKNLHETILLCYQRMTEIATKKRGVPREISVTPSEFEQTLVSKGLPSVPVHDLTRIFEDVRYGGMGAGEDERRRAVSALRIIVAVCRDPETPA